MVLGQQSIKQRLEQEEPIDIRVSNHKISEKGKNSYFPNFADCFANLRFKKYAS
jgi:hypothetical protein